MTFRYQYRTSDNVKHDGVISARDRDAAFRALKKQGIRPSWLEDAPGFANKFFGHYKRWMAICLLLMALAVVLFLWVRDSFSKKYEAESRAQLFGDPSLIQKLSQDGWRASLSEGDAWFARHAIPGRLCDCSDGYKGANIERAVLECCSQLLPICEGDSDELKKMKRMVNGMKREAVTFVRDGGDLREYMSSACERLRIECDIYEDVSSAFKQLSQSLDDPTCRRKNVLGELDRKNGVLRSFGLPTFAIPQ